MRKRHLIIFLLALLLFGLFSVSYSTQVIADLRTFYQDPRGAPGVEVVLRPQAGNGAPNGVNQIDLATVQQTVERRLNNLYLAGTYTVLNRDDQLVVQLPHDQNIPYVASVIASVGEIEFIDGGKETPPLGQTVPSVSATDAPPQIYQTLFTGREIEAAEPPNSATGQIFYRLTLRPAASDRLATFIQTEPQRYICMVVDRQVLNCSVMYHQTGNTIEILPGLSSGASLSLADLAIFVESGPLPGPLQAEIR